MKNLIKLIILIVALLVTNIVVAQTKYSTFQCFVLTYGGDFTFEGNTKAIKFYNEVNHTRFTTFDELYNSNETIVKEFTSTCDKVNNVNYSIKSTPQEVEKQIIKVDSLVSNDIIFTDVEVNHTINVKAIKLVEDGDILSESKKEFRNDATYIYNETKKMYINVLSIPEPDKVVEIKSPNKKLYFVYNPKLDVAKYERKVANIKGNWNMSKGKELGSTPKRTDTKFSIPLLYEWDTCRSRRVLLFGLIKL